MPSDPNQAAALTLKLVTADADNPDERSVISRYLAGIGSKGGKKGGKARAEKLNKKRRHEIAVKAARARWAPSRD